MTLHNIAIKFEMTMDSLAKCMGYSRQALYSKDCLKNANRAAAAIGNLRNMNAAIYRKDREMALRKFKDREKAVKALEQEILHGGDEK